METLTEKKTVAFLGQDPVRREFIINNMPRTSIKIGLFSLRYIL